MEKAEFEIILEAVLEAVRKELLEPIVQALYPIALSACKEKIDRLVLSEALKRQIEDWPEDIFGRHYLEWLAEQLVSPASTDPSAPDKSLRTSLRLVDQKKRDA